jgi:aromatic-L-amino-acid decarboxylase
LSRETHANPKDLDRHLDHGDPDVPHPAYLDRFAWHPEPAAIGPRHEALSRATLEELGRATWDAALDYLYGHGVRRSVGAPATYDEVRRAIHGEGGDPQPAPRDPTPARELLDDFSRRLAALQLNAWHARTLSYFTPPPLVMSILGELLAQITQQGVDVWHAGPSATIVEEEVVRWLCDLVGYGKGSFGLLTSGGVMANFIAMALVRDVRLRDSLDVETPPRGRALEGARVYTSDQTHFSVARALDELGFPHDTLVIVPSDDRFRLQAGSVEASVRRDRQAGLVPIAVVAAAGSTNTGSIDALGDLAGLAESERLWFHVDAAYGGAARFSARDAARVPALERADSVTIDPHKWFFQAYDVGALVVRDGRHLAATFDRSPEYYRGGEPSTGDPDDAAPGAINFYKLGFEGTRRWRALKLWLSWRHVGSTGFGRLVELNVDVARHLSRRLAESADFEAVMPEPELSVVCFRHRPAGVPAGADLDAHQDRLQVALEADGDGWLSTTRLRGATWLRAGIVNYLTTEADVDRLLGTLRRLAAAVSGSAGQS